MRSLLAALFLSAAVSAAAQQPNPPVLQPLPEPPPPPPGYEPDAAQEPQVNVIIRPTETVEEYRLNGKLYMVKVTPKTGKPYYLVDDMGNGKFVRYDDYDTGLRPPMWLLFEF